MSDDELTDYERLREQPSAFVDTIIGIEPFEYQQEFIDADARHRVASCGRQVGKSRMASWLGLHYAVTHAHAQVLITAPSQRQSGLLFDQLYTEIQKSAMSDAEWGIERDTQTIVEFDNDSSIHCLPTGRNGNNIRGFTADMVIVDEAAFITQDEIFEDILEPMLWATDGRMVLTSTPWGKSGYFYTKFDQAKHTDEDGLWDYLQVSSHVNPKISEQEIEQFKEGKTSAQISREVHGKFVEDGDQFFPSDALEACTIACSPQRSADKAWLGADIAGSGDDRTVFYGVDESGSVFLNDEAHEDMGPIGAAEYIGTLDQAYGPFDRIYVDRTAIGEGTVETLAQNATVARKVEPVYFSLQKKQQIYQRLKAAMQAGAITLPTDKRLRTELESITSEKTQNGALKLFPRGGDNKSDGRDDHVDALALAVWGLPDFGSGVATAGAKTAVSTRIDTTQHTPQSAGPVTRNAQSGQRHSTNNREQLRQRRRRARRRRR